MLTNSHQLFQVTIRWIEVQLCLVVYELTLYSQRFFRHMTTDLL